MTTTTKTTEIINCLICAVDFDSPVSQFGIADETCPPCTIQWQTAAAAREAEAAKPNRCRHCGEMASKTTQDAWYDTTRCTACGTTDRYSIGD